MNLDEMFGEATRLQSAGKIGEALDILNRVLIERPDFAAGWNNRGAMLAGIGHPFDAIINYDRALASRKDAAFYNNRGAAFMDLERFDDALTNFGSALEFHPRLATVHCNIGNTYRRQSEIRRAQAAYRSAIALNADYADAHLGLSFCCLELGEFEEGWREFEWRWKSGQMPRRGLSLPDWTGARAANRDDALLIYGEQGHGDVIQFMRYAALAREWFQGKVYLEVRQPLARIARTLVGQDKIICLGEEIPSEVTACVAMMSLSGILGTTIETIPSFGSYLSVSEPSAHFWKQKLKSLPDGLLVGVCWAGMNRSTNPIASAIDARRSLALAAFAPLANIKGISWVSLQKGAPGEQVMTPPSGMTIGDWSSEMDDFYDTACVIANLDLVITVDTAVAHLAAALGKPTWMLSRFDSCWRWFGDRQDSPWYPSLRQFRQKSIGDWDSVFASVADALQSHVANKGVKLHAS